MGASLRHATVSLAVGRSEQGSQWVQTHGRVRGHGDRQHGAGRSMHERGSLSCWIVGASLRQASVSLATGTIRLVSGRESPWARTNGGARRDCNRNNGAGQSMYASGSLSCWIMGVFAKPGLCQPCNRHDQDSQWMREEGLCLSTHSDTLNQPWSEPQHAACTLNLRGEGPRRPAPAQEPDPSPGLSTPHAHAQ